MGKTTLQASDYVHLHNHTQYSLLDGLTKIGPLIDSVNSMGMQAVAMTDHGTLSGAIDFYKEAKQKEVKPIVGIETYVAARKHTDKDPQKDKQRFHLILLAMNETGYKNLMRLSTIASLEGFYYFPRIDHDLLETYNEGVIALSACMGGEIGNALKEGQLDKAEEIAKWYQQIFGDRYYLEIQDHGHPKNQLYNKDQDEINQQVLSLGKKLNIPVVVTCDAHYLQHSDQEAHEILLCVGTGSYIADTNRMTLKNYPLHVEDPKEIIKRWGKEYPEVITNTKKIAERCQLDIRLGDILIPKFEVPKGETEKTYLHVNVYRGLAYRYGRIAENKAAKLSIAEAKKVIPPDIVKRAIYELDIIDSMGFNGYFLIIWDFISWGKRQGIVFGPGRGSAAGSIIAYSLRITELDPIKYDLLFERFLNPDRISMPDIDIDIQDTRRDEVIQYCVEKYGEDRVANIVTFGRMAARAAVRDVARVLQVPYAEADQLAKSIPPPVQGRHIPLAVSIKENAELKKLYDSNATSRQVIDMAIQLEGTIRSHGVHAAGVVIAPADIVQFAPLEMAQKGVITTQYSMGPIEELGLLKMDFLGLSNLTIIKNALRVIKKVYGDDIDIDKIPLDDTKTFELFQRGDTTGVFQFESAGMKRYLKELKPTIFDDLIAMNALYRPGPMQWIEDFIARKHGKRRIEYLHPAMEPALNNTYGVIVYQEQVMQISKEMCGFTGGQADSLRKGIGKKIPEVLKKFKSEFIEGAIKTVGADRNVMEAFWSQLEAFASYAFPKAHSSCYALIAYWTAYLKANYPEAFMAALMTSDFDDTDRLAIEISECRHMGIQVKPPDINESFLEFGVLKSEASNQGTIRFGMAAIKNVGKGAVEEILRVREEYGKFEDLQAFFSRINTRVVNRKGLESLIKAGAFDQFGDRHTLLSNLDMMLAYASKVQKERSSGQTDLFGNDQTEVTVAINLVLTPSTEAQNPRVQLAWERELLGLYLSQHPLLTYTAYLEEKAVAISLLTPEHDGKAVTVGGTISAVREITTKNGQQMAFVKIEDATSEAEVILFPSIFKDTKDLWVQDKVVLVKGKINCKDRSGNISTEIKIMVDSAEEIDYDMAKNYSATGKKVEITKTEPKKKKINTRPISPAKVNAQPKIYIRMEDSDNQDALLSLKTLIDDNPGQTELVLVLGSSMQKQVLKLPTKVSEDQNLIQSLATLFGADNVKLY